MIDIISWNTWYITVKTFTCMIKSDSLCTWKTNLDINPDVVNCFFLMLEVNIINNQTFVYERLLLWLDQSNTSPTIFTPIEICFSIFFAKLPILLFYKRKESLEKCCSKFVTLHNKLLDWLTVKLKVADKDSIKFSSILLSSAMLLE